MPKSTLRGRDRAREAVINPPSGTDHQAALAELERAQARVEAAGEKQTT